MCVSVCVCACARMCSVKVRRRVKESAALLLAPQGKGITFVIHIIISSKQQKK